MINITEDNEFTVTLYPIPDVVTVDKKIYPADVLKKAIDKYKTKLVDKDRAMGETLSHKNYNPKLDDSWTSITIHRVSHIIKKIWEEDGEYKALVKLVMGTDEHPCAPGRSLKVLLEDVPDYLKFKARTVGSVTHKDGVDIVNDDLTIIAWDACD